MSTIIDTAELAMDEAYDAQGFGGAVRKARRERGWTRADLARWLGLSRPTIVKLDAGGPVSLPLAMKALAMLGVKVVFARKAQRLTKTPVNDG